jgi:hypothetical protein
MEREAAEEEDVRDAVTELVPELADRSCLAGSPRDHAVEEVQDEPRRREHGNGEQKVGRIGRRREADTANRRNGDRGRGKDVGMDSPRDQRVLERTHQPLGGRLGSVEAHSTTLSDEIVRRYGARGGMIANVPEPRSFTNPVYGGYFADPFVLRHGDRYYAYGTNTVDPSPDAFEILLSRDLVEWTSLRRALPGVDALDVRDHWAPEVAEDEGRFYLYFSVGVEDRDHYLRVAVAS